MCFTIKAESKEMLHSALGSSGSFLESKKKGATIIYMVIVTLYNTVLRMCRSASCLQCNFTPF